MSGPTARPEAPLDALAPLLGGDLADWRGLPALRARALEAALGAPDERGSGPLGAFEADFARWGPRGERPGLVAWSRGGELLMIEVQREIPLAVLERLGPPDRVLPNEILAPGAYAEERLWAGRGLLLTVARPYDPGPAPRVLRCRAIRPLADAGALGPALYLPFEDRVAW